MLLTLCHRADAQKTGILSQRFLPSVSKATVIDFLRLLNNERSLVEYSSGSIDTGKMITLSKPVATVGQFLSEVLSGQYISVVHSRKKILLLPSSEKINDEVFLSSYNVFGFIKESGTGEPLIDAVITEPAKGRQTVSDAQGYFTLLLPEGNHQLTVSYVGLQEKIIRFSVTGNTRLDVKMVATDELKAVTVLNDDRKVNGAIKVRPDKELYDNILGEADPLRTLYQLPGVQSIPDITNGIVVRGGGPDQNLFYQDGIPIFNPTHMLGMISIVNKTALKSLDFYKNNFPARYGGSLASIIDVYTKDGDMQEWKGQANAGLVAGSLTIEGPLVKDRTAMMVAGRYSWINPFLRAVNSSVGLNFYDLHLKVTHLIGKKDKLTFNVYRGQDHLKLFYDNYNNRQQWGNKAASATWTHIAGAKAFLSTTLNMSNYQNLAGFLNNMYDSAGQNTQQRIYNTYSSLAQYNAASQIKIAFNNFIRVNAGTRLSYTRINPFETNISYEFANNSDDFSSFPRLSYKQAIMFAEAEVKVDSQLFIRAGIHGTHFRYRDFTHNSLQPRLYSIYKLNRYSQLLFSYSMMTQYRHQVINPYLGVNNDIWLPSTRDLKPEISNMFNIGYTYNENSRLIFSAEAYYQLMNRVTNYAEGKNIFLNNSNWEDNIKSGKGWTYGLELSAGKTWEKFQARMAYTLSWNWRKFETLNGGKKFPFKYDRRHYLNLTGSYIPSAKWSFSAAWIFATGDVFTLPASIYPDFDNAQQIIDPLSPKEYRLIYHSSSVNQFRNLSYHRLDVSAVWHLKKIRKLSSFITVGVYNVYGSPSQYMYDLEGTVGKRSLIVTTKYNVFSVMPYISYSLSF
ncbi:MAG: carboxypeptidase-like regulatory domain-containing protein [Chitinophagaceae bacterium]